MVSKASRKITNTMTRPTSAAVRCIVRTTLPLRRKFCLDPSGEGGVPGAERQRERAQQLGPFDEGGRHDHHAFGRGEHRMAPDRLTDRPQQQVTSSAQEAADDHALRVDEVADRKSTRLNSSHPSISYA